MDDEDREMWRQHMAEGEAAAKAEGAPGWFIEAVRTSCELLMTHYLDECVEFEPRISQETLDGLTKALGAKMRRIEEAVSGDRTLAMMLIKAMVDPPLPINIQLAIFRELQMHRSLAAMQGEDELRL